MRLAYVAGPYRSKWGKFGVMLNILRARKVAKELWKMGYAVICPHINSALMDGIAPDEVFLNGDIEILKHCDILVLQGKWWRSTGTLGEIGFAERNKIPVYEWENEAHQDLLRQEATVCSNQ